MGRVRRVADPFRRRAGSSNSDNSPATGNVVYGTLAGGGGNEIAFVGHNNQYGDWIQRSVDLLSYTSATLSFSYLLQNIESPDAISVQVSKDGGATFTTLATYTANGSASPSFDISSYISDKTVIRFAVTGGFDDGDGPRRRPVLPGQCPDHRERQQLRHDLHRRRPRGGDRRTEHDGHRPGRESDHRRNHHAHESAGRRRAELGGAAPRHHGLAFRQHRHAQRYCERRDLRDRAATGRLQQHERCARIPRPARFTVRVTDSTGSQSTAVTSFVRVVPVDDPLVAAPDAFATYTGTPVSGNVLADNGSGPDTDPDGTLSVQTTLVTSPANGTVTMNADGTFTYTPNPAFNGTDTFQYRLVSEAQVPGAYYEYWGAHAVGEQPSYRIPDGCAHSHRICHLFRRRPDCHCRGERGPHQLHDPFHDEHRDSERRNLYVLDRLGRRFPLARHLTRRRNHAGRRQRRPSLLGGAKRNDLADARPLHDPSGILRGQRPGGLKRLLFGCRYLNGTVERQDRPRRGRRTPRANLCHRLGHDHRRGERCAGRLGLGDTRRSARGHRQPRRGASVSTVRRQLLGCG